MDNYGELKFMKKTGFTLAEVLVTMAVIGIIAALTLPALNSDIQVREIQSAFQRTFVDLSDFATYFQVEKGMSVSRFSSLYGNAEFFKEYRKYQANAAKISDSIVHSMVTEGKDHAYKQHSLTNSAASTSMGGICDNSEYMVDGLGRIIFFDDAPPRGFNGPRICVDVNGTKFPNIWGVDIFSFLFTVDGSVIPEGQSHPASNTYETEINTADQKVGAAWNAGTTVGPTKCYAHPNGQTCAYYAKKDVNPKNESQTYWKDFIGKKQYLESEN